MRIKIINRCNENGWYIGELSVFDLFDRYRTINNINLLQQNISSRNKNFNEFLIPLILLNVEFDIMVLFETWKIYNVNNFNIYNYNIFYNENKIINMIVASFTQ